MKEITVSSDTGETVAHIFIKDDEVNKGLEVKPQENRVNRLIK